MSHDIHEQLPGYDQRQIWHDGCEECEYRGQRIAIDTLDTINFERAWARAAEWQQGRLEGSAISRAEADMLRMLWLVQVQLERRGVPIGTFPGNTFSAVSA